MASENDQEQPFLGPRSTTADLEKLAAQKPEDPSKSRNLMISFVAMVVVGLGNKIFQVLQTYPAHNYPLFLNTLTTFVYVPASFAYIWPMLKWGKQITPEALAIPKSKFAVMGALDSVAGIMQSLGVNYLVNGSLIILVMQSAIPISMVISRWLLKEQYKRFHYVGSGVVAAGILLVLIPRFVDNSGDMGSSPVLWSAVLILSCVPMCLSSVYKAKALGEVDIDPVYLNGWIAIFQLLASFPLLIPSAPASNLAIKDIPTNLWNGARCFVGIDSILEGSDDDIDHCRMAPVYISLYLVFNVGYNILIILILKFGSSNLLWLAMTVMVPLGNVAFALPFMPKSKALKPTDIVGLVVIMSGLIIYRFWEHRASAMRILSRCLCWVSLHPRPHDSINATYEEPEGVQRRSHLGDPSLPEEHSANGRHSSRNGRN